jgi:hypothetical protein
MLLSRGIERGNAAGYGKTWVVLDTTKEGPVCLFDTLSSDSNSLVRSVSSI